MTPFAGSHSIEVRHSALVDREQAKITGVSGRS